MTRFDVVVVGAGPAGTVAAREAARRGRSTLLVDKAMFPRPKVCGCCLNSAALRTLARLGLGTLAADAGAVPLCRVALFAGGRSAELPLGGVVLSRERFDCALARAAADAGADVRFGTGAKLLPAGPGGPVRHVELVSAGGVEVVEAGVVVAADGLAGQLIGADAGRPDVAPGSRIGAGAHLETAPDWCPPGRLIMAVGRGGYAGLVRLEDGRLDIAAAFDPAAVRAAGGLGVAARNVFCENRLTLPGVETAQWRGTPALTRTARTAAGYRWFAAGDAAGYVEPFTGEGMAWAVASAARLGAYFGVDWEPGFALRWRRESRTHAARAGRACRVLARALRSPGLCRGLVRVLRAAPRAARPVVGRVTHWEAA